MLPMENWLQILSTLIKNFAHTKKEIISAIYWPLLKRLAACCAHTIHKSAVQCAEWVQYTPDTRQTQPRYTGFTTLATALSVHLYLHQGSCLGTSHLQNPAASVHPSTLTCFVSFWVTSTWHSV